VLFPNVGSFAAGVACDTRFCQTDVMAMLGLAAWVVVVGVVGFTMARGEFPWSAPWRRHREAWFRHWRGY
jgi:hypothetical protein